MDRGMLLVHGKSPLGPNETCATRRLIPPCGRARSVRARTQFLALPDRRNTPHTGQRAGVQNILIDRIRNFG